MNDSEVSFEWGTAVTNFDLLLNAAVPEIFCTNAFRITGLPVDATARDISRQADRLKMIQRFGGGMGHLKMMENLGGGIRQSGWLLPLDPPSDDDAIRDSLQRLRDPERRFIDEFFWFWPQNPGQSDGDEALTVLGRGEIEGAANIWTRQAAQQADDSISAHNLAVLSYTLALDKELLAQTRPLSDEEQKVLESRWEQGFKQWKAVLEQDGFWNRIISRIQELADPRLIPETARRMRKSLTPALLLINAQLAVRAAERCDTQSVDRQLRLMRQSGFGQSAYNKAMRHASEPLRERIYNLCKMAELESEADPENADQSTLSLLDNTRVILAALDCLVAEGDPTRDGAHDEIALCMLRCLIFFANETGNWKVSLDILQTALPVAARETARARIEENITILRQKLWS
jgi:hypothetical protein